MDAAEQARMDYVARRFFQPSSRFVAARAVLRFLKWRTLARLGHDPHDQIRTVSLRRGALNHWRALRP